MAKEPEFKAFVDAVRDSGLDKAAEDTDGAEAIPLTHTSGVTPKDWERVQDSLDS